ncbi:IS66 family insertion sequence element accessory protein TnpB, partial [Halorhodospira sp. 9621]|uniref:IS66 family insertion sequence element accessory protein TnpB n=1 Tax=Halorhodospira sp. 9621 TaxID=2899135 RepID=UPI003FCD1B7F
MPASASSSPAGPCTWHGISTRRRSGVSSRSLAILGVDPHARVFLAAGATDMRKQIDGLALLVADVLKADPFSAHLFCFANRQRDKVKIGERRT